MSKKPVPKTFDEAFESTNDSATSTDEKNPLAERVAELEKQLAEMTEKQQNHWDALVRKEAELQNALKRHSQALENANKYAIEKFAANLLTVVDSLDQALSVDDETILNQPENLLEGVKLTQQVMIDCLAKANISAINPEGESFDPSRHEALTMQPTDAVAPNHVVQVVQKGYSIEQRLIRPARVIVASAIKADATKDA